MQIVFMKAHNKGYTTKNGTFVAPFEDKRTSAKPSTGQYGLFGGKYAHPQAAQPGKPKPMPKQFHPKKGEHDDQVGIFNPSIATSHETWREPTSVATFVPGGDAPLSLNGLELSPWADHPRTSEGWDYVTGQMEDMVEPLLKLPKGKSAASGVIIEEADGRVWLIHPTNQFAGYHCTFPKGGAEVGLSLQANAIKEAFEESGLQVEITGFAGDFERSSSVARFYTAKRVGGTPVGMGWESQAVSLVPKAQMMAMLNAQVDKPIALAAGAPSSGGEIEPIDDWKKTGDQTGSNPGGTYADEEGAAWYCKFPQSSAHAKNEVLAGKLYEAAGIEVPQMKLVSLGGKTGIASRVIDGLRSDEAALISGEATGVHDGFAADAWLANWDSVGLLFDNLLLDDENHAHRIDTGGALLFRAQGQPKGSAFGNTVDEIDSLRNGKNKQAAAVFGGMTDEDIAPGVRNILAISGAEIHEIVNAYGPGTQDQRDALAAKLIARRNNLADRFDFFD